MKALNRSRHVTLKYPRDTPRISRKRNWYDRSEWRRGADRVGAGADQIIDRTMESARTGGTLEATPYDRFTDLMDRAGRVGIRRL